MEEQVDMVYWRIMDIFVDVEEGLKDHVQGTIEIIELISEQINHG